MGVQESRSVLRRLPIDRIDEVEAQGGRELAGWCWSLAMIE